MQYTLSLHARVAVVAVSCCPLKSFSCIALWDNDGSATCVESILHDLVNEHKSKMWLKVASKFICREMCHI